MSKEQILEDLANSVINCKADLAKSAATAALDEGVDPVEAINEGLVKGMSVVGERYAEHKVYLPQVLVAARCLYNGLDILIPAIPKEALADSKKAGTVVVEGDVHDIGKNIVKTMLTAGGYMVTDFGKDIRGHRRADQGARTRCSLHVHSDDTHHGQDARGHQPAEGEWIPWQLHGNHRRTAHIPIVRGGDRSGP